MKPQIFIFFFCFIFSVNAQTNYKYENFGNRSILLNGNVTGSVDDLGATYYNPARLALVEDPVFSINAKIYQLTDTKIDNYLLDGSNLSTSSFEGLPSMVSGTFKLKLLEGHQFAYALMSRNRFEVDLSYSSEIIENEFSEDLPNVDNYFASTSLNNRLRENWFGVSWAKSITENFSIGASLFASYYNYTTGNTEQFTSIDQTGQVTSYTNKVGFGQKSYGAFLKIGAAYVLESIELGLNIDLPYLEVYSEGEFYNEELLAGSITNDDIFTLNRFDDIKSKRKYPFGTSIGAGIPYKKHKLHLNISWNAAISEYARLEIPVIESETEEDVYQYKYEEKLKSTINFGFGAEIYINPKLNAYGSFSTDFSPYDINTSIIELSNQSEERIDINSDYYHYGLGVNFKYKRTNFILGTVFTHGKSDFYNSYEQEQFPELFIGQDSTIKYSRWRFLVGFELLLLDRKINVGSSTEITKQKKDIN